MLDISLLVIGTVKDKAYQSLAAEYDKRLQPYARLKIVELAAASFSSKTQAAAREQESRRLQDFLSRKTKDRRTEVFLLAERGQTFSSPDFALWLDSHQPLILVIGGALGFSPELYARYPQISLSPLTFPHELARVITLEQIYRAAAILHKKSYHY